VIISNFKIGTKSKIFCLEAAHKRRPHKSRKIDPIPLCPQNVRTGHPPLTADVVYEQSLIPLGPTLVAVAWP